MKIVRLLGRVSAMALLACMIVIVLALWQFGSLEVARAYAKGYVVWPDTNVKSLGHVTVGQKLQVGFRLKNLTAQPVQILGCKTTCSCVLAEKLPMVVGSHEATTLTFTISPREGNIGKPFRHNAELYLDTASPELVLWMEADSVGARKQ
jgi:hypothetical protein